jgi:hypothetical protein
VIIYLISPQTPHHEIHLVPLSFTLLAHRIPSQLVLVTLQLLRRPDQQGCLHWAYRRQRSDRLPSHPARLPAQKTLLVIQLHWFTGVLPMVPIPVRLTGSQYIPEKAVMPEV